MKELNKSSNAVYSLNYHLILVVKYRQTIFDDEDIINRLKEFTVEASKPYGVEILNQECGTDHLHLLISTKPSTDLCKFINIIKGHSSRMLRKEFTDKINQKLWGDSLWSPSYYLSTVGNTSLDTLYNYINEQRIK